MEPRSTQEQVAEGMDVFGADGDKVGTIVTVGARYLVVEKGFFFPTDYYIPTSAIARVDPDDDAVWLTVSKDAALHQGWDVAPTADAVATGDAVATDASAAHAVDWTGTPAAMARGTTVAEDAADTVVVPVHEEELTATRTPVERGAVRIEKEVVAEDRVLEVPVTEEQVHVQRRAVDRPVDAGDDVFEDRVIEVPVRGEDVQLQKRTRVAEEIAVTKDAVQRTEQVRGTVRREQVRIADDTAGGDVGVVGTDEAVIEPGSATDAGTRAPVERADQV
jgi:uncharacterized protein (TIGR02271 family)